MRSEKFIKTLSIHIENVTLTLDMLTALCVKCQLRLHKSYKYLSSYDKLAEIKFINILLKNAEINYSTGRDCYTGGW